ncbi:serine hydroxymethyltransferase [Planctomycetota bacterium]
MSYENIKSSDPETYDIIQSEQARQKDFIGLIASENLVSRAVLEASGCEMTNKYAEGYPGKRYYGGCAHVDETENLAIARAKQIFGADHVNVQPHSGTQANLAVVFAVCTPGDTILSLNLDHGGHLSHGHHLNFVGKYFKIVPYGVEEDTEVINYDKVEEIAHSCKPKLIIAGASAYSRTIDFERFGQIAKSANTCLLADIAHIAGLVATGAHNTPVPHADFVTTTTHKTLRGPRGGMIMCTEEHQKILDSTLFPGSQGGPQCHAIAAKAVCFGEVLKPAFKTYIDNVVTNASCLAEELQALGFKIVSGGTDNHMFLVNISDRTFSGKIAETRLNKNGIIVNKNLIPFDTKSPFKTSGIRIGSPGVTSRGMGLEEMKKIARLIHDTLAIAKDDPDHERIKQEVRELTSSFPAYPEI